MRNIINITVPCSYKGLHFFGITLWGGVEISGFEPAACGIPRTAIILKNADRQPTGIFVECVSGADVSDKPCAEYLQIHPLA